MTDFIDALEAQLVTAHRDRRRRHLTIPWRGGAMVIAAAAAMAVIVALVVALASPAPHRAATKPPAHRAPTPPVTAPSAHRVTVAVLNGTTATGIARTAADTLTRNGFREGVITNDRTNQQRLRSTVYYEPGHRVDAITVMGSLHLGLDQVRPMDANARVLGDRAPIVVILGADAVP